MRTLTASDCQDRAARICSGALALGVPLIPGSSIDEIVQDAEWLGSGPDDLFSAGGRFHADQSRFAKAFMRMEQAGRLADLLGWASRVGNADTHAKYWIRRRFDRIETQDEQGQDFLFELEIAGRLARWPNLVVELAEPDILARFDVGDPPIAFACKRPRTQKSAIRAAEVARSQIEASGHAGVIIIGTEAIFHRTETGLPVIFEAANPKEALDSGNEAMLQLAAALREPPQRAFGSSVAGVYLCGLLTYWSKQPNAYAYTWVRRPVVNTAVSSGADVLALLDQMLFPSG